MDDPRTDPILEWEGTFLETLSTTANVSKAAKKAGISRVSVYHKRSNSPRFAALWEEALQVGLGALEDEAVRRAYDGVPEPIYYKGERTGAVRRYSDTLLIFLLKSHKPGVYNRPTRQEVTGADGGPLEHKHGVDDAAYTRAIESLIDALGVGLPGEGADWDGDLDTPEQ